MRASSLRWVKIPSGFIRAKISCRLPEWVPPPIIREQLIKTQKYLEKKEKAAADPSKAEPEFNMKCEALIPLLKRQVKAHFHCHRADDIYTAIRHWAGVPFGLYSGSLYRGAFDRRRYRKRRGSRHLRSFAYHSFQARAYQFHKGKSRRSGQSRRVDSDLY